MARTIIAGGCALIAAALAVFGALSYVMIPSVRLLSFDRNVLLLHFYDGRVRLFWFHSPVEPFRVAVEEYQSLLFVSSQAANDGRWDADLAGPPSPPVFRVPISIGDRRRVPHVGGRWRGLARRLVSQDRCGASSRAFFGSRFGRWRPC